MSLDGVFAAECADVSGVLGDFHLLDLLSEGSTITGTVFTGHADLCAVVSPDTYGRMSIARNLLFVRFVMLASLNEENCGNRRCWYRSSDQLVKLCQGSTDQESAVLALN